MKGREEPLLVPLIPALMVGEWWLQQSGRLERVVTMGLGPSASCPRTLWGWSWDIDTKGGSRLMTLSDDSEERQYKNKWCNRYQAKFGSAKGGGDCPRTAVLCEDRGCIPLGLSPAETTTRYVRKSTRNQSYPSLLPPSQHPGLTSTGVSRGGACVGPMFTHLWWVYPAELAEPLQHPALHVSMTYGQKV